VGGIGNDTLLGGADNDWLDYSAEAGNITVTLNSRATLAGGNDSLSSFEVLLSGSGNDSLAGTSSAETIYAGAGNDTYASTLTPNSESGNDWIEAGLGNDSIYDFGGADTQLGGDGDDSILNTQNMLIVPIVFWAGLAMTRSIRAPAAEIRYWAVLVMIVF